MNMPVEDLECTAVETNEVKKLVKSMCANYDDCGRACAPSDKPCKMLDKVVRRDNICGYFSKCVLPLNPALCASLKKEVAEKKVCDICKREFVPMSNRAVYCSDNCIKIANRIKSRERMKKMRENKGSNVMI